MRRSGGGEWTRERIIAALQTWTDEQGRAPRSYDWAAATARAAGFPTAGAEQWDREHPRWPHRALVTARFGSWRAALTAAGLPDPPPLRLSRRERIETARCLQGQATQVEIAELIGVHPRTVRTLLERRSGVGLIRDTCTASRAERYVGVTIGRKMSSMICRQTWSGTRRMVPMTSRRNRSKGSVITRGVTLSPSISPRAMARLTMVCRPVGRSPIRLAADVVEGESVGASVFAGEDAAEGEQFIDAVFVGFGE